MYLATTDTATAKASPGVFAARREKEGREKMHMLLLFLKLAHPVTVIIMTLREYWQNR